MGSYANTTENAHAMLSELMRVLVFNNVITPEQHHEIIAKAQNPRAPVEPDREIDGGTF